MKHNFQKILLLFFGSVVFLLGCNQTEKSKSEKNQDETVENNFKLDNSADTSKLETKYNDGRITAVRNSKYYNWLVKSSKPFGDTKLELTTVITEWNEYDANIASAQGAFIQQQAFIQEPERSQMIKSGVDVNSQMVGGDEETNRRIKEPAIRYWAIASKMFEQEFKTLKKTESISNRDTNYVTFDFITSNGFYTVQVQKNELESNQSIWSNMFNESKFLNTEMARVQKESAIDDQKRHEAKQRKGRKLN